MFDLKGVTDICKVLSEIGIQHKDIEVARSNVDYYELDVLKYVVDISSANNVIGIGNKFFGEKEEMLDQELTQAIVTVNIYGKDAYRKAQKLSLLLKTQNSVFAQRKNRIKIRETLSVTDLRNLIGTQQKERTEITFKVDFINQHQYSTKRVDEINQNKNYKMLINK